MSKQIIAVDIDDVLANSTDALRLAVNRQLGVDLQPEDYRLPGDYWTQYELVWQQHGIADRISMKELEPQMQTSQSHVLPHDGGLQALRALAKNYKLIIVTSRPGSWAPVTTKWVEDNYPGLFSKVLFTRNENDEQQRTKGEICLEQGVSWLIDDNVEHAQSAEALGIKVILFGDYGWHHKAPADMVRCEDWHAVKEYFDEQG